MAGGDHDKAYCLHFHYIHPRRSPRQLRRTPPEPVAVQSAQTETPLPPTSTPSLTSTATVTLTPTVTHTFTPTITFTPTLSPTLDAIQSLIASGDFVPYEGRQISIVNVDRVDYIADQFGIKYYKQVDGKWVETDN
jgi:hypothetical protein